MTAVWMILSSLLFALMGVAIKWGAAWLSTGEMVFYRNLVTLLMIAGVARWHGLSLRSRHWGAHLKRGCNGFGSQFLFMWSITVLPLAAAVTLNYTSPLIFAVLLARRARRVPGKALSVALLLGFAGIVLVLRPTFAAEQWLGGVLGLVSGVFAAFAYLNVRDLGALGEPDWLVVAYFAAFCCVASGITLLPAGWHALPSQAWIALLAIGVTGALGQLTMTRAYTQGHPLLAACLMYTTVVFSALLEWWLWRNELDLWAWGGILLVVISGILSVQASATEAPETQR